MGPCVLHSIIHSVNACLHRVRHEAAEALGAIANDSTIKMLKAYAEDPDPIVAHSCVVALDMLEFEKSGNFQYCHTGESDMGVSAGISEGVKCG